MERVREMLYFRNFKMITITQIEYERIEHEIVEFVYEYCFLPVKISNSVNEVLYAFVK